MKKHKKSIGKFNFVKLKDGKKKSFVKLTNVIPANCKNKR